MADTPRITRAKRISQIRERFRDNPDGTRTYEYVYTVEDKRGRDIEQVYPTRERAESARAADVWRVNDRPEQEAQERRKREARSKAERDARAAEEAKRSRSAAPAPGHQRGNPKAGTGDNSQLAAHIAKAVGKEVREAMRPPQTAEAIIASLSPYQGRAGDPSFLGDYLSAHIRDNREAQQRIDRHRRTTGEVELRTATSGGLGGLVPPQYLVDQAEAAARKRRVVGNLIDTLELTPSQMGSKSVLPEFSTGAKAVPVEEGDGPASSDIVDPVVTDNEQEWAAVRSTVKVSFLAIDQGTVVLDNLIADMAAAVEEQVEALLFGTGTVGTGGTAFDTIQGLGKSGVILAANVKADANNANPTALMMHKHIVDLTRTVSDARGVPATFVAMHPRRQAALSKAAHATSDGQLLWPDGYLSVNGIPVIAAPSIPDEEGTGDDQDVVYAINGMDMLLVRGPLVVAWERDAEVASWQVVLTVGRHYALHVRHKGAGIGSLTGTIFDEDSAGKES